VRILLDTNVLLRVSDPNHAHHPQAAAAVDSLDADGHELRTVPQNLYEYWVVATRPLADNGLGFTSHEVQPYLARIKGLFPLLRDERGILDRWEALVSTLDVRGRKAHDARLVAAMQRHGLTHILTFNDADFARYSGITVLTPRSVAP
jgi:predicted nucleic acid-binding protein